MKQDKDPAVQLVDYVCCVAVVALVLALPVMWIWNGVIVAITGFAVINFWGAFWINVLAAVLLKNHR